MIILHKGMIYADLSHSTYMSVEDMTHLITETVYPDGEKAGYKTFTIGDRYPTMPTGNAARIDHNLFNIAASRRFSPLLPKSEENEVPDNAYLCITNCKVSPKIFSLGQASKKEFQSFSINKLDDMTETPMILACNKDYIGRMKFCLDLEGDLIQAVRLYRTTYPEQFIRVAVFTKDDVMKCLDSGERFIPKIIYPRKMPKTFHVQL